MAALTQYSAFARQHRTLITGAGMTKFEKPLSKSWDYPGMSIAPLHKPRLISLNTAVIHAYTDDIIRHMHILHV
jgi:hypothetical protein